MRLNCSSSANLRALFANMAANWAGCTSRVDMIGEKDMLGVDIVGCLVSPASYAGLRIDWLEDDKDMVDVG